MCVGDFNGHFEFQEEIMEEACLALEREFKKVLMDLEYTSMTLEAEYDQQQERYPSSQMFFLIFLIVTRRKRISF